MRFTMSRFVRVLASCSFLTVSLVQAQTEEPKHADAKPTLQQQLAKRSQEMIEAAKFHHLVNDKRVPLSVRKQSLIRHNDAERGEQGGLWVIGEKGRPAAVAGIWTKPESRTWVFSARSLSPELGVGGVFMAGARPWDPETVGVEFSKIPLTKGSDKREEMKPAKSASRRFSQMKLQARRFGGHEKWQKQRHELRLLPKELYRYKDPSKGIVDGALFSIAHNTNTECYLMIEVQEKDGVQDWYYALGRFGYAELHINIDKKEVWTQPQVYTEGLTAGPNEAYHQIVVPKAAALRRKAA